MIKRKILVYIILSYAISWVFWLPLLLNHQMGSQLPQLPGQFYMASFGPLLGAVLTSVFCEGVPGLKTWIMRTYSQRFPKKWLALAVLMPVCYGIAGIVVHRVIAGVWPDWSHFGLTQKLPGFSLWQTALVWIVTFGLGEESGWRGFLLPELTKRFSLRKSSLIVAVVWIFWHLPAFWFNDTYLKMGPGIIGWVISLCFGSVLLSWLSNGSSFSVIPVLIWHGGFDLITASDEAAQVIAMVCSMLVIVQGIYLIRKMVKSEVKQSNLM
ncbi:MAG: Abortive infection protein [Eubacterium sp.]|jgi:membrane protease YdiL (CAAX protease family)|nr:Abortive infection protein [Eubacterium sp.]